MPDLVAETLDETKFTTVSTSTEAVAIAEDTYGLLSIGGVEIALPIATLREVVPCPASFQPLATSADALLGAIELRGAIVPVVDVRSLMGVSTDTAPQVLVVMTNGDHVVGLVADELRSVQKIAPEEMISIGTHDGSLLFSKSFLGLENNRIVNVLDIEAVLHLPGMPLVADVFNRVNAQQDVTLNRSAVRGTGAKKYTLVRSGSYTFAFGIDDVHTTIPTMDIKKSVLKSDLCRGVVSYDGFDVPVLDTLAVFGLGSLPESANGPGLILKFNTGYVALALSSLIELRDIAFAEMSTLPSYTLSRPQSFLGLTELETGICLVLDGDALAIDPEIVSHAAINTVSDGTESVEVAENHAIRGDAQLTFSIGFDVAVPLGQVDEILPVPAIDSVQNVEPYVLGVIAHRASVIPVVDLALLVGREPIQFGTHSCLLLVTANEFQVALAVDSLVAIDAIAWTDPETDVRPVSNRFELSDAISRSPLIQVSDSTKLIPQVDLKSWASLLVDPTLEQLSNHLE